MKKILGLDLGTTSIGWALINESENENELSSIIKIGVRVNPLTTDEQTNFEKGKPITINADRTLKRSARRNLQRYKQRRQNLINVLTKHQLITDGAILTETDKNSTHTTHAMRSKAATEEISKEAFARVLLMINKKRGYKSSRKAKSSEDGEAIDGMSVAKRLYEDDLTPGQLSFMLLKEGKKSLPDFYRSDLNNELAKVWSFQKQFYPDILTDELKKEIQGKGQRVTSAIIWSKYGFNTAENKGSRDEKIKRAYQWRSQAINTNLEKEKVATVIADINGNINNSSGYLGAISDRSKELYFNKETVGQYQYRQLRENFHTRLKNQVFYRQDYLDEFERIWETQAKFHSKLTPELKKEIRDIVIFYQRKLRSQKGLVSFCEFESKTFKTEENDKIVNKTIGYKVVPKSSPLFQEFKIWQNLNSILLFDKNTKKETLLDLEAKELLFDELNIKGNLNKEEVLTILGYDSKILDINFTKIEGNRTNQVLYDAFLKILETEGYDLKETFKVKGKKEDVELKDLIIPASEIIEKVTIAFQKLFIKTDILHFNAELDGKPFEQQASYQLWHLLYSYEGDGSISGNDKLFELLKTKFGFAKKHSQILANITLSDDYGSLSAKAIRKIFPFIKESRYDQACASAGYNHSSSLTKEANDIRVLEDKLELLPKNSLRNPVVEKILNQMVNVINAIILDPNLGKPDEIRIELARELKKNAKEREEMTKQITTATTEHDKIRQILINEDGIKNPTRNDIIRYKLYQELKNNGYKTLYSNTYIQREKLFSKEFDIDHIIPQALLFDDSFSNKILCVRQENLDKSNRCAKEYIESLGQNNLTDYLNRVETLYGYNLKSIGEGISKAKYKKLQMVGGDIGKGFIERDLRDSQYIAKKAKEMLHEICRTIVSTTGSVTNRLREDWNLINVMQELNMEKYRKLGLTEYIEQKDGNVKERIVDWSKRNDHRHHAMDALTVAFTKYNHINYLNNLSARKSQDKTGKEIYAIEQKETYFEIDENGNKKRKFKMPFNNFRVEAKKHLENTLISYKAKNKVFTKNKNKYKTKSGEQTKTELTPRGQLHKETIYGRIKQYVTKEERVGSKFDEQTIMKVASQEYRNALLQRLFENDNDPKKAFTGKNSLANSPLYTDDTKLVFIPEKVKLTSLEDMFTIRKEISPENFTDHKDILKVINPNVRIVLEKRLSDYNNDPKLAFSNLNLNPIWLNHEKGISVKRVTISGISTAEALHYKKDHIGNLILDENGDKIPVDFAGTGNNHHVAIYKDSDGNLQDNVVSFYETIARVNQGLPVIDKVFNEHLGWQFLFSMKQNEFFVFSDENLDSQSIDFKDPINSKLISPNLYRLQKFSKVTYGNSAVRDYVFRHHLETCVDDKKELKDTAYKQIKSLPIFNKIVKVRINHIGQIVHIGEY